MAVALKQSYMQARHAEKYLGFCEPAAMPQYSGNGLCKNAADIDSHWEELPDSCQAQEDLHTTSSQHLRLVHMIASTCLQCKLLCSM